MITIHIRDEYIRLGQAMKLAGLTDNGSQAKEVIQGGEVSVNGETDTAVDAGFPFILQRNIIHSPRLTLRLIPNVPSG